MSDNAFLLMARKDHRALVAMRDNLEDFADEIFGFHAEQAAEKALKAWLLHYEELPVRTHDLSFLLNRLSSHGETISEWMEILELNSFGVQFRYEELPLDDEPLDRKYIIELLGRLIDTASTRSKLK